MKANILISMWATFLALSFIPSGHALGGKLTHDTFDIHCHGNKACLESKARVLRNNPAEFCNEICRSKCAAYERTEAHLELCYIKWGWTNSERFRANAVKAGVAIPASP
jgi:hypothetical protein